MALAGTAGLTRRLWRLRSRQRRMTRARMRRAALALAPTLGGGPGAAARRAWRTGPPPAARLPRESGGADGFAWPRASASPALIDEQRDGGDEEGEEGEATAVEEELHAVPSSGGEWRPPSPFASALDVCTECLSADAKKPAPRRAQAALPVASQPRIGGTGQTLLAYGVLRWRRVEGVAEGLVVEALGDLTDAVGHPHLRFEAEPVLDLGEGDLVVARILVAVDEADVAARRSRR